MIIECWIDGEMRRVSARCEVEAAISKALNELYSEGKASVGIDPGSIATFHVFDVLAESDLPDRAENSLTVGVNRRTGFGGMIWWGEEIRENPAQFHWVSKSENPPGFDPRVIADPGQPLWYDKQSCVSLKEVELALKEFCFNAGKQPTVVKWEPSTANGERLSSQ